MSSGSGSDINSAFEQVVQAFETAQSNATQLMSSASSFASALAGTVFAPPTISLSWATVGAPPIPTMPNAPSLSNISEFSRSTPSSLSVTHPTFDVPEFTEVAPTTVEHTAPTITIAPIPELPATSEVEVPQAPTIEPVDTPTYITVSDIAFGGVDLHEDWLLRLDTLPELELLEPTPYTYSPGPKYASQLLDTLKANLQDRMGGGTGLAPAVEQALWDRSRDRETQIALANEAEVLRNSEALGYDLPPGTLAAQLRDAQQAYYDKLAALSRDISIEQAKLEQENLKQTVTYAMQLEGMLVDYSWKMEQEAFEISKAYAENAIATHNSKVEAFKGLMDGYRTYAQTYETIIKGELSKVEVYKARLEGEKTKAMINQTLVDQYKASIEASMANVKVYEAQVNAAKTLVELEGAKVAQGGELIKAYTAQVGAEMAKLEAYKLQLQGEGAKVDLYKAKVDAYATRVGLKAEEAKIDLAIIESKLSEKRLEWEGYSAAAAASAEIAKIKASTNSNLIEGYKAECAATEAQASANARMWESQIKSYEAGMNLTLQTAKLNADSMIQTAAVRVDAAKVGAQVLAQLAVGAMSTAHATASANSTSHIGFSQNYNYSGEV